MTCSTSNAKVEEGAELEITDEDVEEAIKVVAEISREVSLKLSLSPDN